MCFLETVLRDRREGLVDDLPNDEMELTERRYAEIATTAELRLVDVRDDKAVRMGCRPTSFGASAKTWHADGRWRFTITQPDLTGSFIPRA